MVDYTNFGGDTMSKHVLGCDVSHWQGDVDFERMYAAGARFVFLKASQAAWTDRRFVGNYIAARKTMLLVGLYHYLDWTRPADEQAAHFARLLKEYPPDLPPVVDYEERVPALQRNEAVRRLKEFIRIVEGEAQSVIVHHVAVYTSPDYWRNFGVNDPGFFAARPLWIAHYGVNTPRVPLPWANWEFWQFTERGNGATFGAQSRQIDLNYFNGTEQDLLARYGRDSTPQQSAELAYVCSARLRVVVPVLNVRSGPSVTFASVGRLTQDETVTVESIHVEGPSRVWVKHGSGWSALVYDGEVLMQEAV